MVVIRAAGAVLAAGILSAAAAGGVAYLQRFDAPGPQPEGLASDGVHLWVADFQARRLYRMDPATGAVLRSYPAPGPRPEGLAWDGTHLWCADWETRKVYRLAVSDTALTVVRILDPPSVEIDPPQPVGLAWDGAALWITDWGSRKIYRVDPEALVVTRTIDSGGPASVGLEFHGGHLWNGDTGALGIPPAIYKLEETGSTPVSPTTWGALKSWYR